MRLCLLSAIVGIATATAQAAELPDIAGYRLGMPISEVKARVPSSFKVQEFQVNDAAQTVFVASTFHEFWHVRSAER